MFRQLTWKLSVPLSAQLLGNNWMVEHQNQSQHNRGQGADGTPCILVDILPESDAVELRIGAIFEDLLDLEVWPRVEYDGRVVPLLGDGEYGFVGMHL